MKIPHCLSKPLLPILIRFLAPLSNLRLLSIKLCILSEENRKPEDSLAWLFEIHSFTENWIDRQAIALGNGVHLKHKVMDGIHSFFYERIPPNSTVLDVGCGVGALAYAIAENVSGVRVVGVDFNSDHIRFAKKNFDSPNLIFLKGDALLNLPIGKFDVIVLSSILEHINDRIGFLKDLINTYHPSSILIRVPTIERDYFTAIKRYLGIFSYSDQDHKIEYTKVQYSEEMSNAGLLVVSTEVKWGDIWAECKPL